MTTLIKYCKNITNQTEQKHAFEMKLHPTAYDHAILLLAAGIRIFFACLNNVQSLQPNRNQYFNCSLSDSQN